jgi:hypothetical protein
VSVLRKDLQHGHSFVQYLASMHFCVTRKNLVVSGAGRDSFVLGLSEYLLLLVIDWNNLMFLESHYKKVKWSRYAPCWRLG